MNTSTFPFFFKETLEKSKKYKTKASLTQVLAMSCLPHDKTCDNADIVIEQPSRLLSVHTHPRTHNYSFIRS